MGDGQRIFINSTTVQEFTHCVILSAARQEPKDRDEVYILIAVESFLSMVFVRKPESAFLLLAFSGSFDLRSSRKLLSRGAQDDTD